MITVKNVHALVGDIVAGAETILIKIGDVFLGKIDLGDGHFAQIAIPVASAMAKGLVTEIEVQADHPVPAVDSPEEEMRAAAQAIFGTLPGGAKAEEVKPEQAAEADSRTDEQKEYDEAFSQGREAAKNGTPFSLEASEGWKAGWHEMQSADFNDGFAIAKQGGELSDGASDEKCKGFKAMMALKPVSEKGSETETETEDEADQRVQSEESGSQQQ